MKINNYLNEDLCAKCGGNCCKGMPGSYVPEDFGDSLEEQVRVGLQDGRFAIDYWEGDASEKDERSVTYYIRPRIKGNSNIVHASWGGECVFLEENGCTLESNKRPFNCRMLEPGITKCIIRKNATKGAIAVRWIPYENMIKNLIKELTDDETISLLG